MAAQTARTARQRTGPPRSTHEGHYPRGRIGHTALSSHPGSEQAAAAGVRQAHGVLPAVDVDAGRHPRHPGDHHAARRAAVPAIAPGRPAVGREPALRGATGAARPRRGLHHRPPLHCQSHELPRARRYHFLRARYDGAAILGRAASGGRDGVRLLGKGPAALWRGRVRCHGACDGHRGKAAAAALQLRSDRHLFLRPASGRHRRRAAPVAARRARDHRYQQSQTTTKPIDAKKTQTQHCLARYRHARIAHAGGQFHRNHRGAPGAQGRVSRGDRLQQRLDRRGAIGTTREPIQQERLRRVFKKSAGTRDAEMKVIETKLPGVLIVEPKVFGDARGYFLESYQAARYAEAGMAGPFVQDNLSFSRRGILRGLLLQNPRPQGKLVQVLQGEVFDVAVDVRVGSPTFGQWEGVVLSQENARQLYVPPGFAHGFLVTSETALFAYKCTDYYTPQSELSILWNDPDIGIEWTRIEPQLSAKDAAGLRLADIDSARLPKYTG